MSRRTERINLIQNIQEERKSHLIAYITGDRQGAAAQIGGDAIRPMYSHLKELGFEKVSKIDFFLYSQGGIIDVPWRIITMLREHCKQLNVLIPYKAYSAATLIALGADNIVMCRKGELGPIDPTLSKRIDQGETAVQEKISVEDVMAYVDFIKERAGLGDQTALSDSIVKLAEQINPLTLGSIYRTYTHIRLIARKLLTSRNNALEERQTDTIIESLAEKIYSHGHAIGREEAKEIGLPIKKPDEKLENLMWNLLEEYEEMMLLKKTIDIKSIIPENKDSYEEDVILACIESEKRLDAFQGTLEFKHIRQMPPQLNLNLNLGLQLPPQLDVNKLSQDTQQALQKILQHVQTVIPSLIQAELQKQAPIIRTDGKLHGAAWQNITESEQSS